VTSTETLDRPKTDDGSGTEDREPAHYVRKGEIVESAVTGKHLVALCGEVFPATRDTKGRPICQECERVYAAMRP
jgi:Protein of unknown function (DUF3039)